jgi:hypothetical protein
MFRTLVISLVVVGAFAGHAAPPNAEQQNRLDKALKELNNWCETDLTIEVAWDSFPSDHDTAQVSAFPQALLESVRRSCLNRAFRGQLAAIRTLVIKFADPIPAIEHDAAKGRFTVYANQGATSDAKSLLDRLGKEDATAAPPGGSVPGNQLDIRVLNSTCGGNASASLEPAAFEAVAKKVKLDERGSDGKPFPHGEPFSAVVRRDAIESCKSTILRMADLCQGSQAAAAKAAIAKISTVKCVPLDSMSAPPEATLAAGTLTVKLTLWTGRTSGQPDIEELVDRIASRDLGLEVKGSARGPRSAQLKQPQRCTSSSDCPSGQQCQRTPDLQNHPGPRCARPRTPLSAQEIKRLEELERKRDDCQRRCYAQRYGINSPCVKACLDRFPR